RSRCPQGARPRPRCLRRLSPPGATNRTFDPKPWAALAAMREHAYTSPKHFKRGEPMRRTWSAGLGLFLASFLFAANPRECVDLSAREDRDVSSPSGIRVLVNGYNHCSEDIDGAATYFRVNAMG